MTAPAPDPTPNLSDSVAQLYNLKKINVEELSKLVLSMANVIGVLQHQNNTLIAEVRNLTTEVSNLKETFAAAPTNNKKTFADMVRKSLTAPAAQVSILRAAELAQTCDVRKSCVIVRNADLASDASEDNDFGAKVAKECKTAEPVSVFRINLKDNAPPLLKLQLQSKEDAFKILTTFEKMKVNLNGCRKASVRPDFSKPELAKYRQAWKEVIKLNNEAKQRLFTVRNLEVSRIPYKKDQAPWPWTIQQNK